MVFSQLLYWWNLMFNFDGLMTFQVSFVNSIATIKGGTHVDYVTNQITNNVMIIVNKKNKNNYETNKYITKNYKNNYETNKL